MEIIEVDHPLAASRLTIMRDARTDNVAFRTALADLGAMLVYEAARDLPVEEFSVETPVATATGHRLTNPPIIVPIIRAGLGMIDPALSMIPDAQVGFLGMARDEETHEPVPYLEALPEDLTGRTVFLVDPMLATGGSAAAAAMFLKEVGVKHIKLMSIIGAPEGVERMQAEHPDVDIYVAALDEKLNDHGYIVPGLGDAGDRIFGTK